MTLATPFLHLHLQVYLLTTCSIVFELVSLGRLPIGEMTFEGYSKSHLNNVIWYTA